MLRCLICTLLCLVTCTLAVAESPEHWSLKPLRQPIAPESKDSTRTLSAIDRFIVARLGDVAKSLNPETDRRTLIRRLTLDLLGLPPTVDEVHEFLNDTSPDAYERLVDRLLASPHYGERWGKYWLDAAGYAESNGYFQADTDRPLAYRYRDYVVRSLNSDKPFDEFVRQQIAGDELAGFDPQRDAQAASELMIEQLEATHFLRNGPDGSGESDGNPDEVRADRYYALEAAQQILVSSLFGLTIQCAKCHDHKFEAISQRDYYRLQAVLYPVFNIERWKNPADRFVFAARAGEVSRWQADEQRIEAEIAALRTAFSQRSRAARPKATVLFEDHFDGSPETFAAHWSNTAPGDDVPGGTSVVKLAAATDTASPDPADNSIPAPAAIQRHGALRIIEGGNGGDKWVVTKRAFDWTPAKPNDWIQVSFEIVARQLEPSGTPAARVAFFIAAHDFNDNGSVTGGNVLIDGNPDGGAAIHLDYPGNDQRHAGQIGTTGYMPQRNLGLRVTNVGNDKYRLEQIVHGQPEEPGLVLSANDLPDGAFGFEFCCSRSFIVDDVLVETSLSDPNSSPEEQQARREQLAQLETIRKEHQAQIRSLEKQKRPQPGKISWTTDMQSELPVVRLLNRGNPATPGDPVEPGVLSMLDDGSFSFGKQLSLLTSGDGSRPDSKNAGLRTSQRRRVFAEWATKPHSRAAELMARVQVNRLWQHHFGRALAPTSDNLGVSGTPPLHPELLDWLAAEFVRSGWSQKSVHRAIVTSHVYRQTSQETERAHRLDHDNQRLSHFSLRRLDAESLRDAMLAVSGELEVTFGGRYVPTPRGGSGEVAADEQQVGGLRRSIYLQQRRTQVVSLLQLFDAPSVVFNCVQRPTTTMPLQSLTLLNSEFALARGRHFSQRANEPAELQMRLSRLFEIATSREPSSTELAALSDFLAAQSTAYGNSPEANRRAWNDVAQMILASNAFLYVE